MTPMAIAGHHCVHGGDGVGIRIELEGAGKIARQHGGGQHNGEIGKPVMGDGSVPGEKDECQLVELPLTAPHAVGDDHERDGDDDEAALERAEVERLPLGDGGDALLLVENHVDRIPEQVPAIWIDEQCRNADGEDGEEAVAIGAAECPLLKGADVDREQTAGDVHREEHNTREPEAVQIDPESEERGQEPEEALVAALEFFKDQQLGGTWRDRRTRWCADRS